jgi:hypothetical protein
MADLSRLLRKATYGDLILDDGQLTVPSIITETPMVSGELYLTHTELAQDGPINTIRTWIGGTVATSQTGGYLGLYTYDRATGIYTRVLTSGNVATLWTDDFSELDVPMTTEWDGAAGQVVAVATLHIGATTHPALPDAGGWYAVNFTRPRRSAYVGSQTGLPASIDEDTTGPNSRRYLAMLRNDPGWTAP